MVDIIKKVSMLTTIDEKTISKLGEKFEWCICDELHKNNLTNNLKFFCDIGIGIIGIDYSAGDSIKYKFIPSKKFEKMITSTLIDKKSPLVIKSEQSLVKKIVNTYKDLF